MSRTGRSARAWSMVVLAVSALPAQDAADGPEQLAAAVRDRPASEAWPGLAALRGHAAAAPRRAPELAAAARALEAIVAGGASDDRRCLAALCLAALGSHAEDSSGTLAAALATGAEPTELQLGAAIALSRLGKPAAKPLARILALKPDTATTSLRGKKIKGQRLANGDRLAAVLAVFAVAELGGDAKSLSRQLTAHVDNLPDFDSFLIHRHCIQALTAMGKAKSARKAIERREDFERGARGRGGLVPPKPSMFFALIRQETGVSFERSSLPAEMPNLEEHNKLGSAMMDLYDHLIAELVRLRADLAARPDLDHAAWRERTTGLVELAKALQTLASKR